MTLYRHFTSKDELVATGVRRIEVTTAAEVVLHHPAADASHPAFSKLFVETDYIAERGILTESDGGLVLLAMAERIPPGTAARITAVLDSGAVRLERDGLASVTRTRFGVIALDEGIGEDEQVAPALVERLAFYLDLDGVSLRELPAMASEGSNPLRRVCGSGQPDAERHSGLAEHGGDRPAAGIAGLQRLAIDRELGRTRQDHEGADEQGQHRRHREGRDEIVFVIQDLHLQRHGRSLAADQARHHRHRTNHNSAGRLRCTAGCAGCASSDSTCFCAGRAKGKPPIRFATAGNLGAGNSAKGQVGSKRSGGCVNHQRLQGVWC